MHKSLAIFAVGFLSVKAVAQLPPTLEPPPLASAANEVDSHVDSNGDEIQAATQNATVSLREQILRTRLTRDLTINDFLDRTKSQDELTRVLKAARPVGGPRWVDEHTCQIRVELPASDVAAMLMGIAHSPGQHPPIKPEALKAKFADWNRLSFSMVGSSAGGDAIASARPLDAAGKWSEVTENARRSAVESARADATRQVTESIGAVVLSGGIKASDALARPAISARFGHWLAHQPVTRIDFFDNLKVSLTLCTEPVTMAAEFKSAVIGDRSFSPEKPINWDQVNQRICQLPASFVGTASAAATSTSLPAVVLPIQPPDWIEQQLQADASAGGGGSRLKLGRAAEFDAVGKIREKFLLLRLDNSTTLGDAARSDPQVRQAIDRALLQAHTYRVEYHSDGSVKVEVSLNLRNAWDALRSEP